MYSFLSVEDDESTGGIQAYFRKKVNVKLVRANLLRRDSTPPVALSDSAHQDAKTADAAADDLKSAAATQSTSSSDSVANEANGHDGPDAASASEGGTAAPPAKKPSRTLNKKMAKKKKR